MELLVTPGNRDEFDFLGFLEVNYAKQIDPTHLEGLAPGKDAVKKLFLAKYLDHENYLTNLFDPNSNL